MRRQRSADLTRRSCRGCGILQRRRLRVVTADGIAYVAIAEPRRHRDQYRKHVERLMRPFAMQVRLAVGPVAADGRLFAVSPEGKQLWEFNTAQEFTTNNKVRARGGAIATSGASVVDGMVYVQSGYAITSGASGGNVLLAFGVE